jgi:D-beta-D-heptose 7-phosphate kinase/D-beta-D-heptose 1-phosphate adenosyltransferase
MKIVLVTGGFDPIHSGHIAYFNSARELGDKLIVGLNSDNWLEHKKGRAFMPWEERATIVSAMHVVDRVISFNDKDGTATDAIRKVKDIFPTHEIIFANGGDRTANNIPEMLITDVVFKFGVGGDTKANSSSWILEEWKAPKTNRTWGYYRVLHEVSGTKVKELTINPGQKLSMQRHKHRAEYWHVTEGRCIIESMSNARYHYPTKELTEHHSYHIPKKEWHQLSNPFDQPCRIVEIQYGTECSEADIERN